MYNSFNNKVNNKVWDTIVIGGGPAGMMAAGRAGERGRSVLLLEKNDSLGKKLLISGGGRCNVTNNKTDIREMLSKYKDSDKFLFSAFSQFAVKETLEFFNTKGMPTKEEAFGRVFPVTDRAQSVWDVMGRYMQAGNVDVRSNSEVVNITIDPKTKNIIIHLKDRSEIIAKTCVLATGGTSHPETGSTGDGFLWLRNLGHKVIDNDFALVPVALKDVWVKKLAGISIPDIKLSLYVDGKKQESNKGKLLFTHFGISGPTVLNMSKNIGEALQYGEVKIMLDLFPNLDNGMLKEKVQNLLIENSNKKLKNTLNEIIPTAMVGALLELVQIDGEIANHSISHDDRIKLITLLKGIPLNVDKLLGADKAVVSSGGVALEEVNFKTMQSRIIPNLYLVGDILNIDRPSGGYSLQICWTTGYVAGNNI